MAKVFEVSIKISDMEEVVEILYSLKKEIEELKQENEVLKKEKDQMNEKIVKLETIIGDMNEHRG